MAALTLAAPGNQGGGGGGFMSGGGGGKGNKKGHQSNIIEMMAAGLVAKMLAEMNGCHHG